MLTSKTQALSDALDLTSKLRDALAGSDGGPNTQAAFEKVKAILEEKAAAWLADDGRLYP
jgi:hypothetical protein